MNAIDYLRDAIKTYFPESSELHLSGFYKNHRRFNFYFEIKAECPFLLYLNWDGDEDRFTLKCLEFINPEILRKLVSAYPDTGSKAFNIGKPRSVVSFFYLGENRLSALEFKGTISLNIESNEITAAQLMQCIDPF